MNVVLDDSISGSLGSRLSCRYHPIDSNDSDELNIDIASCSEMWDCDWVVWL